ncbi:unnamed protein product [Prorocentrum cordatum]|uniref:Solute carrier family 40 protein n=1 Tax=Prorocentrum cordatum TaxID=2364126 RepID=A0ABN9SDS1_9DINO|nr:unnamed protein product [Polarella glacialis]
MPVEVCGRRYHRQGAMDGAKIMLVRRHSGNPWVVLVPHLSMGTVTITAKTAVFVDVVPWIRWLPMPALTPAWRESFMTQATDGIRAGTIGTLGFLLQAGFQAEQVAVFIILCMLWGRAKVSLCAACWV